MKVHAKNPVGSSVPLVSVAMTSFQSERWIADAIDSVLRQSVDFSIEVVVGDDCSSDRTLEVVRSLQQRHPAVIRLLERKAKLGMQRNFYDTFEHCRGRYIAWLDADDYWTDPLKLKTQVELLESEPGISICSHFVQCVTASGEIVREKSPFFRAGRYNLQDIVQRNFVPSPSILFRNGIHRWLPDAYFHLPNVSDWPLLIEAALQGDIFLMDRTMAAYRITPGSAYSTQSALRREGLDRLFYDYLQQRLTASCRDAIRAGRVKSYMTAAYEFRLEGKYRESRKAVLNAVRLAGLRGAYKGSSALAGTLVAQILNSRSVNRAKQRSDAEA